MSDDQVSESLMLRLARALKAKAVLAERSKQLKQQVDDFRKREEVMSRVAVELLERQRELNFMLHRASVVMHQLKDSSAALSAEFTQLVHELPPPADPKWEETVSKVSEFFEKSQKLADATEKEILAKTVSPPKTSAEPEALTHSPVVEADHIIRQQVETQDQPETKETPVVEAEVELEQGPKASAEHKVVEPTPEPARTEPVEETTPKEDLFEQLLRTRQCDEDGRMISTRHKNEPPQKRGLLSRMFHKNDEGR